MYAASVYIMCVDGGQGGAAEEQEAEDRSQRDASCRKLG